MSSLSLSAGQTTDYAAAAGLSELDDRFTESGTLRRRFEPQWYQNLAMYAGQQWMKYAGGVLAPVNLPRGKKKVVDNRIQGIVRTEVAKMTKDRPVFVVAPAGQEDKDQKAAYYGEALLEYHWNNLNLQKKLRSALLWSRICGAGFLKVYWDPTKGPGFEILVDPAGQPVYNPDNGGPVLIDEVEPEEWEAMQLEGFTAELITQGDLVVEVRSPFDTYPDPLCGDDGIDDARWIGEETVQSREYVLRRFGEDLEPDTESMPGLAEARMSRTVFGDLEMKRGKGVLVREMWEMPSPEFPKGRHVVWAQDRKLLDEDNPYPWLPYVMLTGVPIPGRFWPTSVTEQLISPQTELNKRRSQISENADRIGNPILMENRNADVEYEGLPGEKVEYTDLTGTAQPLTYVTPPSLPPYVENDLGNNENAFREISGQHEITHGQVPAGVTAASAINLLQEQDDTRLGPDVGDMEIEVGKLGSKVLWCTGRFYKTERIIRLSGDDGDWEIYKVRGSFLQGNADVTVQAGSAFPRSKAAKQAAIKEMLQLMLQAGVQLDQRNLRKLLKSYEVGGLENAFATVGNSEQQAQRENRRIVLGAQISPHPYDDDAIHAEVHSEFMRGSRFEMLDAETQARLTAHLVEHQMKLMPPPMPGMPGGAPPEGPSGPVPSPPMPS